MSSFFSEELVVGHVQHSTGALHPIHFYVRLFQVTGAGTHVDCLR